MAKFLSIGFGSYPSSRFHSHHCSEISIYTAGQGEAIIGEEVRPFRPGTVILYPPIKPHRERSKRGYSEFWITVEELDLEGPARFIPGHAAEDVREAGAIAPRGALPPTAVHARPRRRKSSTLMVTHLQRLRSRPGPQSHVPRLRTTAGAEHGRSRFRPGRRAEAIPDVAGPSQGALPSRDRQVARALSARSPAKPGQGSPAAGLLGQGSGAARSVSTIPIISHAGFSAPRDEGRAAFKGVED